MLHPAAVSSGVGSALEHLSYKVHREDVANHPQDRGEGQIWHHGGFDAGSTAPAETGVQSSSDVSVALFCSIWLCVYQAMNCSQYTRMKYVGPDWVDCPPSVLLCPFDPSSASCLKEKNDNWHLFGVFL